MTERHAIVAVYPDADRARKAMAALERAGVGSTAISLEGRPVREAAEDPVTAERDLDVTTHVGKRAIIGGAVGTLLGAIAGLVAGAIAFGGFEGPGVWGAAVAGAIAGGAVGGIITGLATPAMSDQWELTHESDGQVRIRVVSEDHDEVERAAEILRSKEALSVERPSGEEPAS